MRTKNNLQIFALLFSLAFIILYFFGYSLSPATDFYNGLDYPVWKMVAKAGLDGRFLFDHKGPYHHWLTMLGLFVNPGKWGVFLISTLNVSVSMFVIDKIAQLFSKRTLFRLFLQVAFVITLLYTFDGGTTTEEHCLVAQLLPLYLYIKSQISDDKICFRKRWTLIMGLCFGFIALVRINNACVNVAIVLALAIEYLKNKRYKEFIEHVGIFICGICIVFMPVIIYFSSKGMLNDVMHATFLYNLAYNASYQKHDVVNVIRNLSIIVPHILILCCLTYRYDKSHKTHLFHLAWIFLSIVLIAFYGLLGDHYHMILVPSIILVPCIIFANGKRTMLWIAMYLVSLVPFAVLCRHVVLIRGEWSIANNIMPESYYEKHGEGRFARLHNMEIDKREECFEIADMIPSNEKDSVVVNGKTMYFCSNLVDTDIKPMGKYFYFQDFHSGNDPVVKAEIEAFLAHNEPLWIISTISDMQSLEPYIHKYEKTYTTHDGCVCVWRLKR